MDNIKILLSGDSAVTVEFSREMSIAINSKVRSLYSELEEHPIEGIIETIATYRSLMVFYDPEIIRFGALEKSLKEVLSKLSAAGFPASSIKPKVFEIPVAYGGEYGPDLDVVVKFEKKTPEEIIRIHSGTLHYIYTMGFSPGFAYMGSPVPTFTIPRRKSPRVKVPEGSVVMWDSHTAIESFEQGSGWHIIGKTPVHVYDARKKTPILLDAGQWVKFIPITPEEFSEIKKQVDAGTYECKIYEKEDA